MKFPFKIYIRRVVGKVIGKMHVIHIARYKGTQCLTYYTNIKSIECYIREITYNNAKVSYAATTSQEYIRVILLSISKMVDKSSG